MNYEVIIGIEIHLELKTATKMFSPAPIMTGGQPNSCVSAIDIALPGTLPALNQEAVKMGIKACSALHMEIDDLLRFDRKNYYYSDLPKGFQITQQFYPLGKNGYVDINTGQGEKRVRINRLHLEEDTAKQFHQTDGTYLDFNRCGVPLAEIVSEADLRSGNEAMAYVEKLRSILYYLGVSDCKMEEGSLRCDVNISLRPYGYKEFGTKVEIKNLNSIANIGKAINAEIERQSQALDNGEMIESATYRFDESSRKTVLMRKKEGTVDYKFYPEPNIPLIRLAPAFMEKAIEEIEELPDQRLKRYLGQKLSSYDAELLVANKELGDYFDLAAQHTDDFKGLCNWLLGDFSAYLGKNHLEVKDSAITPENMALLVDALKQGKISSKQAKTVFAAMQSGESPLTIIEEAGMTQVSDDNYLNAIIEQVLNDNPDMIVSYRQGKDRALGYLVGQVLKCSQGQANPARANALLKEALTKEKEN